MRIHSLKLLVLTVCVSASQLFAVLIQTEDKQRFNIPKVEGTILLDAEASEELWKKAAVFQVNVETRPAENMPAPVKTTAYLMHDDANIYVFIKADDPEPESIRAHYHDVDQIWDDDVAGVKFDTYHDNQRAYQFFANPLGVKSDSIQDDIVRRDDVSWNAIWDVEGKITAEGYQLEFAIPFRILRFEEKSDEQVWGFDILRFHPRDLQRRFAIHPVDRDISCDLCQNPLLVGMADIESGNHMEWVPYLTASSAKQRPDPVVDDWDNLGFDTEVGADLRWGITPDTTLNLTLNPDFSQVESDVAQIDVNNSFTLFFPERRPFFLEGADYYQSLMNLVYTRNISAPDIGGKLTHTSDGDNLGIFIANDDSTTYLLPGQTSSNIASFEDESVNGVMRYRHDFEDTSSLGALMTMREGDDYHNYVYGVDGLYRISAAAVLRAQIMQSETKDPLSVVTEFGLDDSSKKGTASELYYRREDRDWLWWTRYKHFDEDFRADMGFVTQVGYEQLSGGFRKYFYESDEHWWHKLTTGLGGYVTNSTDGGRLKEEQHVMLDIQGPLQSSINLRFETGTQYWDNDLYDTSSARMNYNIRPLPDWSFTVAYRQDDAIDFANSQAAELERFQFNTTFNIGEHFQTRFRLTRDTLDVAAGELFESTVIDTRLIYQFSVKSYLRLIVQQRETERDASLYIDTVDNRSFSRSNQLLYSYRFDAQTVFFLGYSDSGIENDALRSFEKTGKTLFLKTSYSWLQ